MPPKLVKCNKCGSMVPEKNFCVRCGTSLVETVNDQSAVGEFLDFRNFRLAAGAMKEQFGKIALARLQFLQMPNDGAIPRIKELRVTKEAHVFFAPSEYSELEALPVGAHTAAELFSDTRWATSVQSTRRRNFCLFVHVDSQPVTVTFQLPDWEHMDQVFPLLNKDGQATNIEITQQDFQKTLEQVNIRSADFFFGGAQVQLKIRVARPAKFLDTLAAYMVDQVFSEEDRAGSHQLTNTDEEDGAGGGLRGIMRRFRKRVGEFFVGKDPTVSRSQVINRQFTLAHFYARIRMEFGQAVQQAVRSLQATDLLENKDETRKTVREDVRKFMGVTLGAYGIELIEVPAFEFLCPDLFTQQRAQGEIELRKKWVDDQKKRLELNRQATILAKEEERFDKLLQFEDIKTEIERAGQIGEMKDANKAAAEERARQRDAVQQDYDRGQRTLNAATDLDIEKNKGLVVNQLEKDKLLGLVEVNAAHLALQEKQKDAEFAKMLELAKVLPTLSPQMQQMMLAALKPELAAALVANTQAAGLEQQLAMAREHNAANAQAAAGGVQQAAQLLGQIVQQAGNVLTAAQKPPAPLPPAAPPPPPLPGGPTG